VDALLRDSQTSLVLEGELGTDRSIGRRIASVGWYNEMACVKRRGVV